MTVHRPLYWTSGSDLRQMADADLDVVSYYIRKRYAWYLDNNANIPGDVNASQANSDWTSIGTITDTVRTSGSSTRGDDNDNYDAPNPDTSFEDGDLTGTSSSTTTNYQYTNHNVAYQTAATINATGMLYWSDPNLKIGPTAEQDLMDTIVDDVLTQARTGDEVGSYRISTSAPAGGTWSNKGTMYTDQLYQDSSYQPYTLYLKTANTTEPTTSNNMIKWDNSTGSIKLVDSDDYSLDFIDSIWMNVVYRNHLLYSIVSGGVPSGNTDRGTIYDKEYASTSSTLTGPSGGVYTRTDYPSGGVTDATGPYNFIITGRRTP